MLKLFSSPFYSPDIPSGTGSTTVGGTKDMSQDDIYDFLRDDEEKETIPLPKPKEKDEEQEDKKEDKEDSEDDETKDIEKDEEDDELKELEEELEEPDEEKMALITPIRRQEILKAYPDIFKKFPYLEVAYYRDRQFSELFQTPQEAKEAVEAKEILGKFETDVMSGNTENILKAVKEENPQSFYRLVDNYLNTLANVDEKAYYHVLGNIGRHTIIGMVQEARRLGVGEGQQGVALQNAAQVLNQFLFGSSAFTPPTNLSQQERPEDNAKEREVQQREQQFVKQQFEYSRNDLNTRINSAIKNTITANIDPKSSMSDYVRKSAEREAMETLEELFSKDASFIRLKDKLWERAFEEGFTRESLDKIRTAYNAKARALLPSVIKKARNNAWRGMGKRVRDDDSVSDNKGPVKGGQPRSQVSGKKISNPKDIPKGMSTLEFLNSD